jgi:hypothetical protein
MKLSKRAKSCVTSPRRGSAVMGESVIRENRQTARCPVDNRIKWRKISITLKTHQ